MTKKASMIALVAVAVLALAGAASAATLPLASATQIAKKLAQQQVAKRHLVSFHIVNPKRVGTKRIVFAYDDRSKTNVYCTAALVVDEVGTRSLTARFSHTLCQAIPADVLQFEAVTTAAQKAVDAKRAAVQAALNKFTSASKSCLRLKVPKAEVARAALLLRIGRTEALEGPVDGQLAAFVKALGALSPADVTLQHAGAAWALYYAALRQLPPLPHACADLRTWAKTGYRAGAAPVDFAQLAKVNAVATSSAKLILLGAQDLAKAGAFPNAVVGFTPDGLLLQVKVRKGVSGGA